MLSIKMLTVTKSLYADKATKTRYTDYSDGKQNNISEINILS